MKTFTAAVIGCGARGGAHIDAYKHLKNVRVAACCDVDKSRREKMAKEHGLVAYDDVATMLERERPDIVHITTPPRARVDVMVLVAGAGVPLCTVEKPIATAVEDWRQLVALERRATTKFAVCHQMRWQQHLIKCQAAAASGKLGAPKFLDMSAGMNISGQGTLTLNYGRSLIGDPQVVSVFASASGWDTTDTMHPGPEATEAFLTFDNGVRGLWTSGHVSPRCGDPNTVWQHVRVAAYADRGRVNYEEFGVWEIVGGDIAESGTFGSMNQWWENNLHAQAEFHRAMLAWHDDPNKVPGTSLKASLHEWAVVLALYQSALERRPVDLASFDPHEDLVDRLRTKLT